MNERIKLLALQAMSIVMNGNDPDGDIEQMYIPSEFTKKFAELIVKECMDIARDVGNISDPDDFALDRCYEIEQRIQDRFGVEE